MRTVGIHDGTFHADEVTACALLLIFDLVDRGGIVRTRDLGILEKCDFVCDVGGVYDPKILRFDHHQSDYQGALSSAGMVLLYLKEQKILCDSLYAFLADQLITGVDEIDNGAYTPRRGHCTFSGVVSEFMPICHDASSQERLDAFFKALDFVIAHIKHMLKRYEYIQEARGIVEKEMAGQKRVLYFDRSIPWLDAFFNAAGKEHPAQFIIMPSEEHWKLRTIPPSYDRRMEVRTPLPAEWAGLIGRELATVSGIEGAIFCHKGRFISIWKTRADAEKALEVVLEQNNI